MKINDAHCHFFSSRFFETLAGHMTEPPVNPALVLPEKLGVDPPGTPEELAARWIAELDANDVRRAAIIGSVPADEPSVGAAVRLYPDRFVGYFMLDPMRDSAVERAQRAFTDFQMRVVCLFPAMQRYSLHDPRTLQVFEAAAAQPGAAVFVHCGVLTVSIRKKLGLPSRFDIRHGNPLDLHSIALQFPDLPIIIPHFGAGFFREALMVADLCPNVLLDTSSSNGWIRYQPGLTLVDVFRHAIQVAGPNRLLFGTDSSFFPRGWQRPIFDAQSAVLDELGIGDEDRAKIMGGNFDRLFT